MGRYYNGDINGKFWFGIQSSDDAEYFGATQSPYINYEVYSESLKEEVIPGIEECMEELGVFHDRLKSYLTTRNGYNESVMADEMSKKYDEDISKNKIIKMLTIYARLLLGLEIKEWMENNPNENCRFEAEL